MIRTIKRKPVVEPKVFFDVSNTNHLKEYAHFLKTDSWQNSCSFILEFPFSDVPSMINYKITAHTLSKYMK